MALLIAIAGVAPFFVFMSQPLTEKKELVCRIDLKICQENLLKYLKARKDKLAAEEIEKILSIERDNLCALWGKAEILRRSYKFQEAQKLLNEVLAKCPDHAPSLISLSYIRYHDDKFNEAVKLLRQVLKQPDLDKESGAMVYMLMGSINAKRAGQGGWWRKFAYGTRIKGYFEKAKLLAGDLPEVYLGLGTFCLLAPKITGGDVDRAIEELECAVKLAPDFATPHARLAQAYKIKGDIQRCNFYLKRAKELDPENEVLKEID